MRQHRLFLALDLAPPVGLLLIVVAVASWQDRRVFHSSSFIAFAVITAAWATLAFARWHATSLTVGRDVLEVCRGLFVRSSLLIPASSIQKLAVDQSVVGLLMSYGDLTICTNSGHQILPNVPDPDLVRDRIFAILDQGV